MPLVCAWGCCFILCDTQTISRTENYNKRTVQLCTFSKAQGNECSPFRSILLRLDDGAWILIHVPGHIVYVEVGCLLSPILTSAHRSLVWSFKA